MQKKGLAVNMLILMALALVALFILGFIISRGGGTYAKSTSCEGVKGSCMKSEDCNGKIVSLRGCGKDTICCVSEEVR